MQIPETALTAINCATLLLVIGDAILGAMIAYGVANDYQAGYGFGPVPVTWTLVERAAARPLGILLLIFIPAEVLLSWGKVRAATLLTLAPYVAAFILAALALLRAAAL